MLGTFYLFKMSMVMATFLCIYHHIHQALVRYMSLGTHGERAVFKFNVYLVYLIAKLIGWIVRASQQNSGFLD
jgi:hypothetical protein